jgi:xylulokinase
MAAQYLLGIDIGSSSVKVALLDIDTGRPAATAFSPSEEMAMQAPKPGFAEQDPELWWNELINAMTKLKQKHSFNGHDVKAIGISYQMHGLVCVDKNMKPVRPSIIWCDSRAVAYGQQALEGLGAAYCLGCCLNSPGNFTASKLYWVKQHEPENYKKIHKVMLPGDYIALKLTGHANTTISGLSEGILWNFRDSKISDRLLDYYGIHKDLLSSLVPTFGDQGKLKTDAANALGLHAGIPVSYRAGDQPNNAFSLNVLKPGEVAATAGTSGVVYGITDQVSFDNRSRVNSFVHVNHTDQQPRYGVLLCINGTGSLNSWLRKEVFAGTSYETMNELAASVAVGSDGLLFYPFGNGAERILGNADPGAGLRGLQFTRHQKAHLARAAQEGIVFSLYYGMNIMREMGMPLKTIRAGYANMFLSDVFSEAFANTSGCTVELYNTDGAVGAARAAGKGAGIFSSFDESFRGMEKIRSIEPNRQLQDQYSSAYENWKKHVDL